MHSNYEYSHSILVKKAYQCGHAIYFYLLQWRQLSTYIYQIGVGFFLALYICSLYWWNKIKTRIDNNICVIVRAGLVFLLTSDPFKTHAENCGPIDDIVSFIWIKKINHLWSIKGGSKDILKGKGYPSSLDTFTV